MHRQPILFVSIPCGVPTAIAARSKELRAIGVLFVLKALHSGGLIKAYYANSTLISASFGFGKSKLLENIAVLRQLGFVEKVGKNLRLTSSKSVAIHYGCCPEKDLTAWVPQFHRLPITRLDRIELELKAYAAKENFAQQKYTVAKKLADQYLLTSTQIPSNPTPAARRRALRGYDPVLARRECLSLCEDSLFVNGKPSAINPIITLSRAGFARLLGRRSARTGTTWVKKFVAAGLMTDTVSRIRLQAMSQADFLFGRQQGIYNGAHSFFNGHLYRRLSNVVEYIDGI